MCGRFVFYSPTEAVTRLFPVDDADPVEPRYNIAPTNYVAAIRQRDSEAPRLVMLRWGLIPFWAKDKAIGNRLINARAETVAEKPSFRSAFKACRCLILANGFYEWKKDGNGKTPHLIGMKNRDPFAMAGLWERWRSRADDDETIESCTIVTTTPNALTSTIHNRMPVILDPDDYGAWLDPGTSDRDALQAMLRPFVADEMQAFPVSREVNNPRNQGPALIEPAA